jgi:hypothetical protein
VATSRTFRGGGVNKSRLTYRWRSSGLCAQKNKKDTPSECIKSLVKKPKKQEDCGVCGE